MAATGKTRGQSLATPTELVRGELASCGPYPQKKHTSHGRLQLQASDDTVVVGIAFDSCLLRILESFSSSSEKFLRSFPAPLALPRAQDAAGRAPRKSSSPLVQEVPGGEARTSSSSCVRFFLICARPRIFSAAAKNEGAQRTLLFGSEAVGPV